MRFPKVCVSFLVVLIFFSGCGKKEAKKETKHAEIKNDEILDISIIHADTLNPLRTTVRHNAEVLSLLYDSLFVLTDENEAVPNLCTNLSVSRDGRKVTLSIRENVRFQDGTTLRSRDVVSSVNFILKADGFYKERLSCVEEAQTNGNKLELLLNEETEDIACLLDFPILPEKFLEQETEQSVLVAPASGSGLYLLEEYRINQVLKLRANKEHHSGSAPKYEKINIHFLPDEKTALYMLENRRLDALSESAFETEVYTPPAHILSVPYATDRLVFLGVKEGDFSAFSKSIKSFLSSWIEQENIGKISEETSALEDEETLKIKRGKTTLLYCLDSFVQTRTAQKILQEAEKSGGFMEDAGVSKREYFFRIRNGAYDFFLAETEVLPNRDTNDFLAFQKENSPAGLTGLFYANEMLYFQKEIAVDGINTKNPYFYFTEGR